MENLLKKLRQASLSSCLFGVMLITAQCSSTGTTDSAAEETAEDDVVASNAATGAVTDSVTNSLSAITSGGGLPALIKATVDDESEESSADDESDFEDDDYNCSYNEEEGSVTCDCPGGGTSTFAYDETFELSEEEMTYEGAYTASYDACVISECGDEHEINGSISGTFSGSFTEEGGIDLTATTETEGECSGISVDEINIGFQMTMTYDGVDEEVFGTICFDPPGDVIEFSSLDELMTAVDPENSCEALEDDESDDESDDEDFDEESDEDEEESEDEDSDDEEDSENDESDDDASDEDFSDEDL